MSELIHIDNISQLEERSQLLRSIACNKVFFEGVDICEDTIKRFQDIILRELEEQESNYIVSLSSSERFEGFAFGNLLPRMWYYSNGVYVPDYFRKKGIGEKLKRAQHSYAQKIEGCLGVITSTRNDNIPAQKLLGKLGYTLSPMTDSPSVVCELRF